MVALVLLSGCGENQSGQIAAMTRGTAVEAVDLSVPLHPLVLPEGVRLSSAKNAWSQWALQLDCSQFPGRPVLRLPDFGPGISISVFQVLPAPVNLNDAGYVRQTGDRGDISSVPRALLPLVAKAGAVDLLELRDPSHPFAPDRRPSQGQVLIWVDVHIASGTSPGERTGSCQLQDARGGESAGTVPIHLSVDDLTLPVEPNLHFASSLDWETLARFSPDLFGAVPPRLLRRGDPRRSAIIQEIDAYIQLAHENKIDLFIPRLQPIVKWPLDKMPEVSWEYFDSLVSGWFNGKSFADGVPLGFWPLPAPDSMAGFDLATQCQYWHQAAEHFDQHLWLDRSPVVVQADSNAAGIGGPTVGGPINQAGAILISAQARQILAAHPRLGTLLPMPDDQLELVSPTNSAAIALGSTSRICALAPGLVSPSPIRDWPDVALPPRHWVDASANVTGLASEQAVRMLAWLAFDRDASLVQFGAALPFSDESRRPANADQLPLFYPGQWYGTAAPVGTLSLKWIRQAEQDYEYLFLASQRHDRATAIEMCQLITRPVQLRPAQAVESIFDLLAGTSDSGACEQARQLLVNRLSRSITNATDPVQLQTLRWFADRQHPTLVGSSVRWMWNLNPDSRADSVDSPGMSGNYIDAVISAELFNPADSTPLASTLQSISSGAAWESNSPPTEVSPLARYQAGQITTTARYNLSNIAADSHQPITLRFTDGMSGQSATRELMLPVAISERREKPVHLDAALDEWFPADAILLDQPLVKMLDRHALQSPELQMADSSTAIFSGWSDDNFYLAFRLAGVTAADLRATRNFVEYDHGRAWGEDLCEMLIQPIYIDNTTGPTLHIVAKPGGDWVEQQRGPDGPWEPFEASGVRYASSVEAGKKPWRGELAIPWRAIQLTGHGRPTLMRFNFIQHQNSTGQSASWAGPIDQSRDGKIAGLVVLNEP